MQFYLEEEISKKSLKITVLTPPPSPTKNGYKTGIKLDILSNSSSMLSHNRLHISSVTLSDGQTESKAQLWRKAARHTHSLQQLQM